MVSWVFGSVLLALRLGPPLVFAPPFSLTRTPVVSRVLLALGLAGVMLAWRPSALEGLATTPGSLVAGAARELFLGGTFALAFQLAFAALAFAGRTVDVQAGLGLAALINPTTRAQESLVGALFALATGAVFFALDGHVQFFAIVSASLDAVPVGAWRGPASLAPLLLFLSSAFFTAFGVVGAAVLAMLLGDLTVAALSRAAPQMNALVLGLQVKTLILLAVLPLCLGAGGALLVRLVRLTLDVLPRLA